MYGNALLGVVLELTDFASSNKSESGVALTRGPIS
jgi:hypothetical protein